MKTVGPEQSTPELHLSGDAPVRYMSYGGALQAR